MRLFHKRYHPPGTSPGTLVQAATPIPPRFRLVDYSGTQYREQDFTAPGECRPYLSADTVTWIHVQGNASPEAVRELGELLGLHELALEDTMNTGQRPKLDAYGDHIFAILNRPVLGEDSIRVEQVSLFAGARFLVSFHEGASDPFEPVRERLRRRAGLFPSRGSDYLLYSLIDLIIDAGFPLLEEVGERIEALDEQLVARPRRDTRVHIHQIKRELLLLRRMLWPQREVVNGLLRGDQSLITPGTRIYFRDCYDHTIQVLDLIETYREMTASLLEMYIASVSNRLNDIMRVLTVISTLFIPLTFITGIYGMNFDNPQSPWSMPELRWYYGYPFVWLVIIATVIGLLIFFKRRKWW